MNEMTLHDVHEVSRLLHITPYRLREWIHTRDVFLPSKAGING